MPGDPSRWLDVLLSGRWHAELVRDPEQRTAVVRHLAPIAASAAPVVVWSTTNVTRVDAVVRSDDAEWRVVYFSADGDHIDALDVFRKRPPFDGVAGGRAVIVNGPSGAGESAVLELLDVGSELPWVVFDEPVMGAVKQGYLIWRDAAAPLHRGFLDAVAAIARAGNYVAVAAAGHPQVVFDATFAGVPVLRVGLDCEPETLFARERGREGRWGGIAADSLDCHRDWTYDVRFDSSILRAPEIARRVLELVDAMGGVA